MRRIARIRDGGWLDMNLAQQLISQHLVEGTPQAGEEIAIRIDQTLTQDATGTLVMLELEAMQLDRVRTELSVQYVDHNLLQQDYRNPDDHVFLRSACRRFGLWYSPPGNGVSHPVHQERFGRPGATLLGADSHTCAAGALGMLAIGAGGLDVAMAMAGEPFHLRMPAIWRIRLEGRLPEWVSAKDVILELLRRHGVAGGVGRILEYTGPGLADLSAMDRHVIANMGAELGATTSVFPSDDHVRSYLASQGRSDAWRPLAAEADAAYDLEEEIDLAALEPLIAMPSSPGRVERVADVAGEPIHQAYVGSSANPGFRDFAMAAEIVRGRAVHERVSFDVNPTSRQMLMSLVQSGHLGALLAAGARLHQTGCNGCIGMGQAPATDRISLRTTPRNFPGRSGTLPDRVCLVSPETAAASALHGVITDPRSLAQPHPRIVEPRAPALAKRTLLPPPERGERAPLEKGPNIASLPALDPMPTELELPVLLVVDDDVSTDTILPAGARVLPFRSNIPRIARFLFEPIDPRYAERADAALATGGHAIVAGDNYGQGSSREHAALAPRALGLRLVLARSFARIHRQNLVACGVLPLLFVDPGDHARIGRDDVLALRWAGVEPHEPALAIRNTTRRQTLPVRHDLSAREQRIVSAGGLINLIRAAGRGREAGEADQGAPRA
ncbi:MAG: aconitate hydratase [Myxococcota bacterium]